MSKFGTSVRRAVNTAVPDAPELIQGTLKMGSKILIAAFGSTSGAEQALTVIRQYGVGPDDATLAGRELSAWVTDRHFKRVMYSLRAAGAVSVQVRQGGSRSLI